MGNVKTKVFLGYITLIMLASLIVWIIYSEILTSLAPGTDLTPANKKIMYINTILTNLYQSEGLGRNYAQTGQIIHYREYKKLMDTISSQIGTLSQMTHDPVQQMHTDSIKTLLKKKQQNLRELSVIKKANSPASRYQQAIEILSAGMDSLVKSSNDSTKQQLKINKTVTTNYDSVFVKQKKKKFFERLANVFSTKRVKDSALYVSVNQTVQLDSLIHAASPADSIADYFTGIVQEIKEENLAIEKELRQKERKVLENDLIITMQLRRILSNIEKAELVSSFQQIKAQQESIRQTTWLIVVLGALSLFSIVFFLINILKDLTKSQHYRQSLERANAYSEMLLRSKEQFMLSITHDLKSPLSSIIGFTGLIEGNAGVPMQKQYLQRIRQASEHILRLINDLLDLARLDSGKLTIESFPFNFESLVKDTIENFRPQAIEKNIDLACEYNAGSPYYKSDPVRITQILRNLISNAIKFTEEGSVNVRVSSVRFSDKSDQVTIEIIDTGIGIPQEKIQSIFQEFGRVRSSLKQYEGTGLGLTITKKITQLMHGSIRVKSTAGEGSRFTVTLPLEREGTTVVAENFREKQTGFRQDLQTELKGKRVWLVDDDLTLLEMTTRVLESAGLKVFPFNHPLEALRKFEKNYADFLITDIQMPEMNGFELMTQIKKKNRGPLRAIAMSGQQIDEESLNGFNAFVQKPFLSEKLIAVLSGDKKINTEILIPEKPVLSSENKLPYSLHQIAAFASNEPETLRQILVSFLKSSRQNIVLLKKYLYEENEDAISALSHKMLPLFRQLEAHAIVELLVVLEQKNRTGVSQPQWYNHASSVLDKIEKLMTAIQHEEGLTVG
jgi:signal transduction histidine kinase/DNA-binding NarL/FixJ family response regulator